jgi:hypothetical protein
VSAVSSVTAGVSCTNAVMTTPPLALVVLLAV